MPRDPDGKRPSPGAYEQTLQVRVRGKNPLIERKKSARAPEAGTGEAKLKAAPVKAPAKPEKSEVVASIYESIESTDRTEEVEVAGQELLEALTDRPGQDPQIYIEEEETVVADEAPKPVPKWLEEGAGEFRLTRGGKKPRAQPPLPRASAQVQVTPVAPAPVSPVPKGRLGNIGTDAAGAEVHRQMIDLREKALPSVDSPALKILRSELTQGQLTVLDQTLKGELDRRGIDPALSPKRALEHLIHDRTFQELAPKEQAILLRAIVPDPRDVTTPKAAIALLKTGAIKRLRLADRGRLWSIFEALGPELRARLAQVAARQVRGRSVIEDRDLSEVGLLEHLEAMLEPANHSPALDLVGFRTKKALALVIGTLAQPERLSFEDGTSGVVGMLEYALAESSPAELVRIWRHLVSPELSVELAGKATLNLGARLKSRLEAELGGRYSPVRVVFETLPELARSGGRQRRPTFIMPGGHGIDADILSRALGLVYGVGFTVAAGAANALRHLERVSPERMRIPPVFVSVLSDRGERLFIFDRIEGDNVFVRAPHGKSSKRAGATRLDPKREVVDPDRGLERIKKSEFEASVGVGLIPRGA